MIEIKFPADRKDIAEAMGRALLALADCTSGDIAEAQTPDPCKDFKVVPPPPRTVADAEDYITTVGAITDHPIKAGEGPMYEDPKPAAVGPTGAAEDVAEAEPPQTSHADASVDEYGVAFDGDYCSTAKEPFYGSGPRKGQWKKRKGVSEDVYDEWHSNQRLALIPVRTSAPKSLFDSSAAFAKPGEDTDPTPQSVGDLMTWISKRQAAKEISYQDVQDAYARTGITVYKLFNSPAEQQAQHIRSMWEELK